MRRLALMLAVCLSAALTAACGSALVGTDLCDRFCDDLEVSDALRCTDPAAVQSCTATLVEKRDLAVAVDDAADTSTDLGRRVAAIVDDLRLRGREFSSRGCGLLADKTDSELVQCYQVATEFDLRFADLYDAIRSS